jgi:2-polyprenyl-6-methoxyphenol hydroxylase-like FAD-dependent oxidoreductase
LIAAIRLRIADVRVRVIDELMADDLPGYPAVVHPRTLRVLSSLGVTAPLEWRGHDIERVAVYTDGQRRAVLELPSTGTTGGTPMTLPQQVLREVLLHRLSSLGTQVEWQTRVASLSQDSTGVQLRLVRRERSEQARAWLEPEWRDVTWEQLDARFVIATDGPHSKVREQLGIGWLTGGPRQFFVCYEIPDQTSGNKAHLVIYDGLSNSIYPFQSGISRFTFEVATKVDQAPDPRQLCHLLALRMPWYVADSERFEWTGQTDVTPGLAERFGEGRVWLTGDAAHSNGLLGGQSFNLGICDADELAQRIIEHLDRPGAEPLGAPYAEQRQLEWQRLSKLFSGVSVDDGARDWVRRNLAAVLPSLPASGADLDDLLEQLREASP